MAHDFIDMYVVFNSFPCYSTTLLKIPNADAS